MTGALVAPPTIFLDTLTLKQHPCLGNSLAALIDGINYVTIKRLKACHEPENRSIIRSGIGRHQS